MVFANGKKKLLPLIPLIAALAACGGGGGGGGSTTTTTTTATGLQMPVAMSALAAPTTTTAAPAVRGLTTNFYGAAKAATPLASFPTTSNIATDEAHSYIYDASMESLQTVNMILCLMDQTKASAMVNKGDYIALVNEDKCEQGKNGSSSGSSGQSSGKTISLNKWTIRSTRADNSSPQYVKIWVPPSSNPGDVETVLVEVTINEGVSTTKPYGDFVLTFNGVLSSAMTRGSTTIPAGTVMMKGLLKTVSRTDTKLEFQFINLEGDNLLSTNSGYGFQQAADVILDDVSGTAGIANTRVQESYKDNTSNTYTKLSDYALAFNSTLVHRNGSETNGLNGVNAAPTSKEACLSKTGYNSQVWRYNLYYDTTDPVAANYGKRVTLNSGFPFTYSGSNGYVGYWGVWMEGNVDPATLDGKTINKMNYSTGATTPYTVRVAKGKLIKRTAIPATLTSLQGQDFNYWGPVTVPPAISPTFGQYQVTINGSNLFMVTGSVTWTAGSSGPTVTAITPSINITPTAGQALWLWSDALGGNVTYVGGAVDGTGAPVATYYSQEFMQPAGVTANTLYCYDRCVKGGLTETIVVAAAAGTDSLYYPTGTEHLYTISVTNGKVTLTDNSNLNAAVDLSQLTSTASVAALTSLGNSWGIQTGEMVTAAIISGNWWDVYNATTSYRWETGPNNWNQMITVTDSTGAVASFDKPISINYTHTTADDANTDATYNGKKFLLQYGGDGELWGFPWMEDTTNPGRWRSSVTLLDGVQLTDGTNHFVVKAIEQEKTMKFSNPANAADFSACAALSTTAAAALTLPGVAQIVTVSITLPAPTVTTAPAVIEGVLQ